MTEGTSKPVASSNNMSFSTSTFTTLRDQTALLEVLVGTDLAAKSAKWVIHEDLLTSNSGLVKAMMSHGFQEKSERIIRMPEEEPDIFDHYVNFLYSGRITTSVLEEQIEMYCLGTRLQDPKFEYACYTAIKAAWTSYSAVDIRFIMDETVERDPLRELCIEQVSRGILSGRYKFAEQAEKELLSDYMAELMDGVVRQVALQNNSGFSRPTRPPEPSPASPPPTSSAPVTQPSRLFGDTTLPYTPNIGWHFGAAGSQPQVSTTQSTSGSQPHTASTQPGLFSGFTFGSQVRDPGSSAFPPSSLASATGINPYGSIITSAAPRPSLFGSALANPPFGRAPSSSLSGNAPSTSLLGTATSRPLFGNTPSTTSTGPVGDGSRSTSTARQHPYPSFTFGPPASASETSGSASSAQQEQQSANVSESGLRFEGESLVSKGKEKDITTLDLSIDSGSSEHSPQYTPTSSKDGELPEEKIRCVCGHLEEEGGIPRAMICCDGCDVWQHNDCVGFDEEYGPDTYLCEKCKPEDHEKLLAAMWKPKNPWEAARGRKGKKAAGPSTQVAKHIEDNSVPESSMISGSAVSEKSTNDQSVRSDQSQDSVTDPELYQKIEDAIRRSILPELNGPRTDQKPTQVQAQVATGFTTSDKEPSPAGRLGQKNEGFVQYANSSGSSSSSSPFATASKEQCRGTDQVFEKSSQGKERASFGTGDTFVDSKAPLSLTGGADTAFPFYNTTAAPPFRTPPKATKTDKTSASPSIFRGSVLANDPAPPDTPKFGLPTQLSPPAEIRKAQAAVAAKPGPEDTVGSRSRSQFRVATPENTAIQNGNAQEGVASQSKTNETNAVSEASNITNPPYYAAQSQPQQPVHSAQSPAQKGSQTNRSSTLMRPFPFNELNSRAEVTVPPIDAYILPNRGQTSREGYDSPGFGRSQTGGFGSGTAYLGKVNPLVAPPTYDFAQPPTGTFGGNVSAFGQFNTPTKPQKSASGSSASPFGSSNSRSPQVAEQPQIPAPRSSASPLGQVNPPPSSETRQPQATTFRSGAFGFSPPSSYSEPASGQAQPSSFASSPSGFGTTRSASGLADVSREVRASGARIEGLSKIRTKESEPAVAGRFLKD